MRLKRDATLILEEQHNKRLGRPNLWDNQPNGGQTETIKSHNSASAQPESCFQQGPFSRGVFDWVGGRVGFSYLVFNSTSDPQNLHRMMSF